MQLHPVLQTEIDLVIEGNMNGHSKRSVALWSSKFESYVRDVNLSIKVQEVQDPSGGGKAT
jgi:hypothetical protein